MTPEEIQARVQDSRVSHIVGTVQTIVRSIEAERAAALLQISEMEEWIWNQGHIRAASHRAVDCARCKLEEKKGTTQKPFNATPVPMILFCQICNAQHIDEGDWATRPHRTHECQQCRHQWRPSNTSTVGVKDLGPKPLVEKRKCDMTGPCEDGHVCGEGQDRVCWFLEVDQQSKASCSVCKDLVWPRWYSKKGSYLTDDPNEAMQFKSREEALRYGGPNHFHLYPTEHMFVS